MKSRVLPAALAALLLVGACAEQSADPPAFEQVTLSRFAVDSTGARGALSQTILETYDAMGQMTSMEYRGADGEPVMRIENVYADGLKTSADWRRGDGSLSRRVLFTYDDQGRLLDSRHYRADSSFAFGLRTRWQDDGLANETGPIPEDGQSFVPNTFYTFDGLGNELGMRENPDVDSLRLIVDWRYLDTDEYGNWLLRERVANGRLSRIEERVIRYAEPAR